jgi:hypothetical protein
MSIYPPPTRVPAIFNPADFISYNSSNVSLEYINATFAKLAGGQTIVAQETFSGGIKTNAVDILSGSQLTVTAPTSQFTGNVAVSGSATIPSLTVSSSATIPALTLTSSMVAGSITTLFASFGSNATTHTITSTQLSWLAENNWTGEMKIFADDGTSYGGIVTYYLVRYSSTLSMTQVPTSKYTNMSTFDATVATTSGVSTITVNVKRTTTDTTGAKISWIFIGAK